MVQELFQAAVESWEAEGRPGRPRLVGVAWYALGPNTAEKIGGYMRHYFSFLGPEEAAQIAKNTISSTEEVKDAIEELAGIGMDELVFLPTVAEMDQLERLADIAG